MEPVSFQVFSWTVGIFILVVAALFRMVQVLQPRVNKRKEELAAYKLEVSKEYVSVGHLKEVEERIMAYLKRIEDKLDGKRE